MLTFGARLGSAFGFVLRKHDRDPNVSTHIRIAAVLWDQTIKSLCVCLCLCLTNGLVPEQGRDPNVSAHIRVGHLEIAGPL